MNKYLSLLVCGALLYVACGGSPTATLSVSATLSTPSISFGDQAVGAASAAQTITLSNTGSARLRILGIAAALPFSQTNTCGSGLAAGATCMIDVMFTPIAEGHFSGDISITDNANDSPQIVALDGTGVQPPPTCLPQGAGCYGPGPEKCCAAPRPHHAFCSNPTGWGNCVED